MREEGRQSLEGGNEIVRIISIFLDGLYLKKNRISRFPQLI